MIHQDFDTVSGGTNVAVRHSDSWRTSRNRGADGEGEIAAETAWFKLTARLSSESADLASDGKWEVRRPAVGGRDITDPAAQRIEEVATT